MNTKSYKLFELEEGTELSRTSNIKVRDKVNAWGEVVLVRHKNGWKIIENEDVLIVKK